MDVDIADSTIDELTSKLRVRMPEFVTKNGKLLYHYQNDEIDILLGSGPCSDQAGVSIKTNKHWCIGKVPPHVREVDEKAYTPKIVAIGPFHYKAPALDAMEIHKLRFLNRRKNQIFTESATINLEDAIKAMEKRTRKCYSEQFEHMSSNDFVQMLLLDACFIVDLFRLHEKGSQGEIVHEYLFGTRWVLPIIARDLLLMENQLPMFILEEVFNHLNSLSDHPTQSPLDKLALQFFKNFSRPLPGELLISQGTNTTDGTNHLLALFQSSLIVPINGNIGVVNGNNSVPRDHHTIDVDPTSLTRNNINIHNDGNPLRPAQWGWVKNARTLSWAGINFLAQEGDPGIVAEFKGNKLTIPALLLGNDNYVHLLRNLIAYEQSSTHVSPYVTCFGIFLGSLIDTPEDVQVLFHYGIIKHTKVSHAKTMNLIKSLSWNHQFDMKDCFMIKQIRDINKFSQSKRGKIRRKTIVALKKCFAFIPSLVLSIIFIALPIIISGVIARK